MGPDYLFLFNLSPDENKVLMIVSIFFTLWAFF